MEIGHLIIIFFMLVLGYSFFIYLEMIKKKEEVDVSRWAIGTDDFKFLIESYLDSLKYDSIDAKEIRRELLEQIKKVCPDWDDHKIIVHERN